MDASQDGNADFDGVAGFDDVAVVLVSPAGLRNIGSAARAMKNTGFRDLVIVDPPDFRCRETYDMAPHSHEVLDGARCFDTLEEAIEDRQVVFGVTARTRFKKKRLIPGEAAERYVRDAAEFPRAALVFGPEDHGLTNEHLELSRHLVGIPTHPDLESLNLAQAVLLVCHAFFVQRQAGLAEPEDRWDFSPVKGKQLIHAALTDLLVEAGYQTPAREKPLQDTLKRIVFGGDIESRDTRNILAAVRHLRHVLEKK